MRARAARREPEQRPPPRASASLGVRRWPIARPSWSATASLRSPRFGESRPEARLARPAGRSPPHSLVISWGLLPPWGKQSAGQPTWRPLRPGPRPWRPIIVAAPGWPKRSRQRCCILLAVSWRGQPTCAPSAHLRAEVQEVPMDRIDPKQALHQTSCAEVRHGVHTALLVL